MTAHHVRDWIKSLHPHLETRVQSLFGNNRALRACRGIANANKHFELDLDLAAYRKHPPSVRELDYSAAPVASRELGAKRRLKVVLVAGQRVRVEAQLNSDVRPHNRQRLSACAEKQPSHRWQVTRTQHAMA